MNIIITNVGRRGYLVEYLKQIEWFQGKVFVSDCDATASGLYGNNDGRFILPRPVDNAAAYVDRLIALCKEHEIRVVLPVIDPEIDILSKYRAQFLENGIKVIVSNEQVLAICYNKLAMNTFLDKLGLLTPQTYCDLAEGKAALDRGELAFPVIIKPIYGSGSVETSIVKDMQQLEALFHDGLMIQEIIDGQEYGVDVLNSFNCQPVRCTMKKKLSMRSGETDKSITVKDDDLLHLAVKLASALGHEGNLDFDVIKRKDRYYFIDLNPRFGGGYPATQAAGGNYLELILRMLQGENVVPDFCRYQENLLVMKTIGVNTALLEGIHNFIT